MPIEWTQPDGSKISLKVFGDEFYGRTETLDGYTVVFDPATKSYHYANRSKDGRNLVATGVRVGKGNPKALGLAKRLDIDPEARKAMAKARFEEWDKATENSKRWSELKAMMQAADEGAFEADSEDDPSQAPPSFTTTGEKVGLTLLIDFSDAVGTIPQAEIINYCNSDSYTGYGNNGSVKKYFQDNSNNLLTYTNTVTAYIRMAQPKSYYNDTTQDSGARGRLLINDAIDIMKALPNYNTEILPTFDTLTVDGSNRVLACNVFFAGANSGVWAKGLWPHAWSLASAKELSTGGKKVYKYQITNLGTSLTLGTFCHENGHMLCGYPDLYDYQYDSVGGAGKFCLMGSGGSGTNPVLINAYFKRASGWTTTTELTSASSLTATLTATLGHADYNKIYRYANPVAPTTEYFLFENRQKTGRDSGIPASGIAIWHIDQLGNRDNQSLANNTTHANYECSLIQADNLWHFQSNTNSGDSRDLYYLGNAAAAYTNTFSDISAPDARWWSGAASGVYAYDFSAAGATMTFKFGLPANTITVLSPNGGEFIYLGSTQTISWLSNTSGDVKIELFKGGVLNSVLSASETNDGSYTWTVSSGLPAGSDYSIKISSVANPAYNDSSNAAFSLAVQPTLADALDTTGLTWTGSGNANWFAQAATTKDGIDAAQSGAIGHNQNSSLETAVTGPGTLTFWWKVSSESNYDFLRFYLNGTEQTGSLAKISGTVDWVQKTVSIPPGIQSVRWSYTKDGSVVSNADAAWVDQVVYTSTAAPEIAVEQPVGVNLADGAATIDCGFANPSSSSDPVTFTVKNVGDADLTGLALSKDGSHDSDFTLGSLGATTLAPGASTTFTVTFSAGAAGIRNAAIHIASNDTDENPFDINVTGTGVTVGTLAVTPAGNLNSSGSLGGPFSPNSLEYTLSNPGTTSIDWTAAKTAAWVDLSSTGGTLAPGANTTVIVSINANADSLPINNYSDTVSFTNTTNGNGDATRDVFLTVTPIPATITLANLSQTYDGSPKPATATTNPPGLAHSISYNGSPDAPTDAGTYAVLATITDPDYTGTDSKDLVIAKAGQTINFAALDTVTDIDAPFALTATASSGLPVTYTSSSEAVASVDGSTVTIVGLGSTTITASQAGNSNYQDATPVQQTLTVVRANPLAITSGPYKVLIGQSLSLNGSASQPSHGETITSHEWDLNNDETFGDATGAEPDAISVATLISAWQMEQGLNTIQLKVTDSAGKISISSTTVEVILSLTWDANNTGANRTDGAGAWLGANQWWDGSTNVTWASGSSATFGNTGTGGAVTLASPTTINTLTFNVFSGTYNLGTAGQAVTLNGGITKNTGTGAVTITSPVILGADQTWENHSAAGTAGAITSSGAISGGFGLTKSGTGHLILTSTSNSYTGSTRVWGGTLRFGNTWSNSWTSGSLPAASNLEINNGIVEAYYAMTRTLGTGAGQIQITGGRAGFTNLQGDASANYLIFTNTTTAVTWGSSAFNPGTLVLNDAGASCVLRMPNPFDLNAAPRTVEVSASGPASGRGSYGTMEGNLSGAGASLIKTGAGTLMLNGTNTYNGGTAIDGGGLWFNKLISMPNSGVVAVNDSGILSIGVGNTGGWTTGTGGAGTIGGLLAGLGGQSGGTISYSGNVAVGFNITGTQTYSGTIADLGTSLGIHIGNKDSGTASDPFTAAGTLTFSSTNTYTGGTFVNRGTLILGHATDTLPDSGTVTVRGGTLALGANSDTTGAVILTSGSITGTTGVLTGSSYDFQSGTTVSAILGGSGALTKSTAGSVTLSGSNIYSGGTSVNAGTLTLGHATNTLADNGAVHVNGGTLGIGANSDTVGAVTLTSGSITGTTGVLTGTSYAAESGTISAILGGSGTLTKSTAGTLILSGANTYSGGFTLDAGSVQVSAGTYTGFGTGTLTVNGGQIQTSSSTAFTTGNDSVWNAGFNLYRGTTGVSTWTHNGDITLGNNVTVNSLNNGWTTIVNGAIGESGGSRSLSLTGNTLNFTLNGDNTYTGATVISSDDLTIGGAGRLGGGDYAGNITLTNSGNALIYNSSSDQILRGNISGSGTLTKGTSANSILTLSGTNSYSGATAVNAGKLFVNGSLSNVNAALTVASGATLGGTGTVGRNITIAAGGRLEFNLNTTPDSHAPLIRSSGRTFAFSGASELTINSDGGATPGTYTLITGGNNITGSAPATVNLPPGWTATVSIFGNSLLLDVVSTDNTLPTLVEITDDKSGAPLLPGTLVTYNVTFSEDMDATTVTEADFGNAGTSAVTIGAVSEISPGVFTVQATPTSGGTLQLRINESAILKDIAGNNLVTASALTDDTVFTIDGAAPTLIGITDDKSGGPVAINTLVTYTVTFDEDMDAITVTDADFGNTGTSAVTIGSVSETSPGVFTVQATPTTAGTLQLAILATAELKDSLGNPLDTTTPLPDDTIITVDGTAPTLVGITDDKSGGPVAINTLVTYTVTFDEDMDATTVTDADFGNTGTSAVTIGSVSETSPGVFTVQATPTTLGTLQLAIIATAELKDTLGNPLDTTTPLPDDTIITVDGTAPTLTSITDDKSGGPVTINTLVTYTVTFDEDMDATTVTDADFGNTGTSAATIGSISETSPGVFTVQATPTTAGTLQLAILATAELKDAAGNALDTTTPLPDDTIITVDGTSPALVGITDDKSGGPVEVNTLVTYTVTFDEDMDAITVTDADFGNIGTSAVTIGSVSETSPGVFTVQVTPTTAGTLQLAILATAELKDSLGNPLDTTTPLPDDTVITVDGTAPTLTSITDDKSGGPVAINTLVTYTVTFDEDMDVTTVTDADFGNTGTSAATIGSISEISPGVFTVQVTPTSGGTLQLRINESAILKDIAGNHLDTASALADDTVITVDSTSPTLVGITDDKGGGPVAINTLVTYTVTFDEDMDATTITNADFGNAGTSAVTIGSISEISPGVFTVEATSTTAGTLQLAIIATTELKDTLDNALDTTAALPDDTLITVQTPYQSWSSGTFAHAFTATEPDDDPDGDGLANLLEYAFDTDPTLSSNTPIAYSSGMVTAHGQPVLVELSGNRHAVFARRVDHAFAGLNYAVRFSADLEAGYWETSPAVPTVLATDGVIEAVAVPYPETVPASGGPKTARFFQVMVTGN